MNDEAFGERSLEGFCYAKKESRIKAALLRKALCYLCFTCVVLKRNDWDYTDWHGCPSRLNARCCLGSTGWRDDPFVPAYGNFQKHDEPLFVSSFILAFRSFSLAQILEGEKDA